MRHGSAEQQWPHPEGGLRPDTRAAGDRSLLADVVTVAGHPLRARAFEVIAAADGSAGRTGGGVSPKGLADQLDVTVCSIAYHVRRLAEEGLIELTAERPARGAVEHFYGLSAAGESVLHAIAEIERGPPSRAG